VNKFRLLALDLSTNTGWALFENGVPIRYGVISQPVVDWKAEIKTYKDYPSIYPRNFVEAATLMSVRISDLIVITKPNAVVIEETNTSRQRFSQKILEWIHFCVVESIRSFKPIIPFRYLTTRCWRLHVKCFLSQWPEYHKWNSRYSRIKRKSKPNKAGARVAKLDGKVISRVDSKKLSVIIANKYYDLKLSPCEDDVADAINLGRAALELGLFSTF